MPVRKELHFLTLPPEIRTEVFSLILNPDANRTWDDDEYSDYNYSDALALFRVNRQVYTESRKVFRDLNVFVRVDTPWPEAEETVAIEGHVPILVKGEKAASFSYHSLTIIIDAPQSPLGDNTAFFVFLVDDLPKFAKTWFYSNLSHPGLNQFLRLTLQTRDPYTPEWDEKRLPKVLQRKMLMPFGILKDMREVVVTGDPKPLTSIEAEMRAQQAIPTDTVEQCLKETIRLKLEGNAQLNSGNYREALALYVKAWEAMHIIVKGRQRHIHADAYFAQTLHEEPFKGKNGQHERLQLRVQLVANTCLVYLKLEQWEEASFWGMRSINMLRESMGLDPRHDISAEDEALPGFPAGEQMGRIYYRTGVAFKKLGDKSQARKLLRVASIYFPRDENVKTELAACALALG